VVVVVPDPLESDVNAIVRSMITLKTPEQCDTSGYSYQSLDENPLAPSSRVPKMTGRLSSSTWSPSDGNRSTLGDISYIYFFEEIIEIRSIFCYGGTQTRCLSMVVLTISMGSNNGLKPLLLVLV
jgi:hypothetical protein